MSDSQMYEEITVGSDGVAVIKRFEEDEFPVPAIAFEFSSERDESVTVRLSDTVPDEIEVEDLGFHPEYGSEYWTIDEETIVFEKDLDANSEYTTVYGIRATGSDDVEQFLTEPAIENVDPPLPEDESEDIIPESDDDVVKNSIVGDGEIPGLEDDGSEGDDAVETLDLKDPNASDDDGSSDGGEGQDAGGVIEAMAREINNGDVSPEYVKYLQKVFASSGGSGGSGVDAARLEQLQSDISDLRAYTGALEDFLEENGTGEQLIEDFQSQLTQFEGNLTSIESQLSDNSETVESVSDEVETVRSEMDSIGDEMESVSSDVASLGEEVSDISGSIDDVTDDVDEVSSGMGDLESTVETLEEQMTNDEVADRMDDLQEDLDSLQKWQEQIKETFGG